MALTPQEETLFDFHDGGPIEWSDCWTEEDLFDAAKAALQYFDDLEREGH
jgi:hypothetical protein